MEKKFVVVVCGVSNEQASAGANGLFTKEQADEYIRLSKETDALMREYDFLPSYHITEVSVETGIAAIEEEKVRLGQAREVAFPENEDELDASDGKDATEVVESETPHESMEDFRERFRQAFSKT